MYLALIIKHFNLIFPLLSFMNTWYVKCTHKMQVFDVVFKLNCLAVQKYGKKGKGHPCAGTEDLYRPYGP
jgi:hypothetical protein